MRKPLPDSFWSDALGSSHEYQCMIIDQQALITLAGEQLPGQLVCRPSSDTTYQEFGHTADQISKVFADFLKMVQQQRVQA